MFIRYLRRELSGRRKQSAIVAIAMALAIGLVVIVNALSVGVRDAQAMALESVYGVGTDITVAATPTAPTQGERPRGPRFEFGADEGTDTGDGTTAVSQSVLNAGFGSATFDAAAVKTATSQEGVAEASGVLSLTNTTFNGELPQRGSAPSGGESGDVPSPGGPGGGGAFDVDSFTVMGVDANAAAIGPLASATLQEGRLLGVEDTGKNNVVVDAAHATTEGLNLKDTVDIAGTTFTVVGIVAGSGADAQTSSNTYIPLDVAQKLSGSEDQISTIYVQASSAADIPSVKEGLQGALPDNTVNTQDDLAESVTGSLSTASGLVSSLGTWLSVAVLAVAFLLAILLTLSGVARRTREFGTLKAIGWRNSSIVKQVAGESLVQSLLGGALGIVVGLGGIAIINVFSPTLTAAAEAATPSGRGRIPGVPAGIAETTSNAAEVVLNLPFSPAMLLVSVGIAIAGGLLAGTFGGWRAARLRPAEALRSVA